MLRIQSIPISIEISTKRAQLIHSTQRATVEVTRERGRANITTTPATVKIDSYETRASMGLKTAPRSIEEFAEAGRAAALESTREYAQQGNTIMDSHGKGNPMADIAMSKIMSSSETIMTFLPTARPQMWVEGGTISFDYTMDKLTFDWHVNTKAQMEYVPGSIEFTIARYPEVIIEYLGSPIYVPPSSDPNYSPPPSLDRSA